MKEFNMNKTKNKNMMDKIMENPQIGIDDLADKLKKCKDSTINLLEVTIISEEYFSDTEGKMPKILGKILEFGGDTPIPELLTKGAESPAEAILMIANMQRLDPFRDNKQYIDIRKMVLEQIHKSYMEARLKLKNNKN